MLSEVRWKIALVLIAVCVLVYVWFEPRVRGPNICSLEYREIYLLTHDTDAVLCKNCPFEPWYRDRLGGKDCPAKPWYEP
jgi:hypothetical protein